MKLIVDISEDDYKECKFRKDLLSLGEEPTDLTFNMRMETLIANGTSLSEELENQKTGHWIKDEEMSIMFDIWTCSECGGGGARHFNYCPNCGAKMEG